MKLRRHIPNIFTCCNLMCGLLAVAVSAMNLALVFLLGAFVFDFLDGFSARKMKAESAVGKDLDSLADLVSFGVAPAVMAFKMLSSFAAGCLPEANGVSASVGFKMSGSPAAEWLPVAASAGMLLLPVFTALRLARFNNDSRQKVNFIGLPASASGLLIASLASESLQSFGMLVAVLVCGFLMLSSIPFFSFKDISKFQSGWTRQRVMLVVILIAIIIYLLTDISFSLCIVCVVLFYVLMNIFYSVKYLFK